MPPEAVPSNASVASTGLGLRYIGGHVYGYSGIKVLNNNTVTFFEFTTGSTPLKVKVQWYLEITGNVASSKNFNCVISINDIDVIKNGGRSGQTHPFYDVDPMHMIIPPNSIIKIESTTNNASDVNTSCVIVGRVYE